MKTRSDCIIQHIEKDVVVLLEETSISCEKIGKKFNCSRGPIYSIQKLFDISRPFHPRTRNFPEPCKWCGVLKAKPGFSKTRPNRGKFCSKKCYTLWQKSKENRGKKHPRWVDGGKHESVSQRSRRTKSWKIWREKVYRRDGWRCVLCGSRLRKIAPHHILPKRDFPKLKYAKNNGATLCWRCHERTFNREYKYIKKIVKKLFGGLKQWRYTKHFKKQLMQRKVSGFRKRRKA